eukprot:982814-Pelagomonas_calceolata.AAC.9
MVLRKVSECTGNHYGAVTTSDCNDGRVSALLTIMVPPSKANAISWGFYKHKTVAPRDSNAAFTPGAQRPATLKGTKRKRST